MIRLFGLLAVIVGTAVTQPNRLPPVINGVKSTDGTEELAPGSSLNLTCVADYPVEWILPNNSKIKNYSNPQTDGRLTRNTNEQLSSGSFQAQITVVRLKITDTGFYLCRASDLIGQSESGRSSSSDVFLFVNDEKPEHNLLEWTNSALPVLSLGKQVIPCRSTTFDVTVELYINSERQSQLVQESYNSRIGFTVAASELSIYGTWSARQAECRARTKFGTSSLPFVIVIIDQGSTLVPQVTTETPFPYVGQQNFEFKCTVMTDQPQNVEIDWEYPLSAQARATESKTTKMQGGVYGTLTIADLKKTDSGKYTCLARKVGPNSGSNSTGVDIDVSATKGHIVVQSTSNADQTVDEGRAVSLFVTFQAWPDQYTKTWFKTTVSALHGPSKVELKFDSRIRNSSQAGGGGGSSMKTFTEKIDITNANINDSGTYILLLVAGDDLTKSIEWNVKVGSDEISSNILVTQQTNISVPVDTRFLQLNSTYKLICVARGLPLPSIAIRRMPCIRNECSDNQWEDVPDESANVLTGTFEIAKVLDWDAQQSFTYQCLAKGSGGTTSASPTSELIVTDVKKSEENEGMDIIMWSSTTDPKGDDAIPGATYENDGLVAACRVQKYDYRMITWWLVNTDSLQETQIANVHESIAGYDAVYNTSSAFSNRLELHFDHLRLNNSGLYLCKANLNGISIWGSKKRDQVITVEKIEKPFYETEDDHSPSQVEVKYEETVTLYCSAIGTPKPKIAWYKDGKNYTMKTGNYLSADDRNLTILKAHSSDQGVYSCKAHNRAGSITNNITLTIIGAPESLSKGAMIAIAVGSLLLLSIIFCLGIMLIRQAKQQRDQRRQLEQLYNQLMDSSLGGPAKEKALEQLDPNIPLNRQADDLPYDPKYELPRELLRCEQLLGEGQFGKVLRGTLTAHPGVSDKTAVRHPLPVAVKVPRNGRSVRDQKALLDELKIMIAIGQHVNVLGLIGAVTKLMAKGELYVVTELCALGSLLDHLRKHRASFLNEIVADCEPPTSPDGYLTAQKMMLTAHEPHTTYQSEQDSSWAAQVDENRLKSPLLTTSDLLSYAFQISNGMDYLAQKTLIHRDLAARNLLLTEQRIVKIADFGLARQDQVYHIERSKNVPLPIKWMALESILDQEFTVKSDVWSLGVVFWEIFALGEAPYADRPLDMTFIDHLKNGNRLGQPINAPDEIYQLMRQCWLIDVQERPSFGECRRKIGEQLQRCSNQLYEAMRDQLRYDEPKRISNYYNWRPHGSFNGDDGTPPPSKGKNGFHASPTADSERSPLAIQNESYMLPTLRIGERSRPRPTTHGVSRAVEV